MSLFSIMNTSASGMTAQRLRMDTISQNIANATTTRGENGEAYRRKVVVFEENKTNNFQDMLNTQISKYGNPLETKNAGVKVKEITEDKSDLRKVYEPNHPDADEEGYVYYPNVNSVVEMTNLISASRSYEANITVVNATKSMYTKALEISKR